MLRGAQSVRPVYRLVLDGLATFVRPRTIAHAHSGTHSYVYVLIDEGTITGNVQFPIADLNEILGLSIPQDETGALEALRSHRDALEGYAAAHLTVGDSWKIEFTGFRVLGRKAGSYAIVEYRVQYVLGPEEREITVSYDGILHARHHHEAIVIVKTSAGLGPLRTETEQRFTCTPDATVHTVTLPPDSIQNDASGAVAFVEAEIKEYWRRARKRLRR